MLLYHSQGKVSICLAVWLSLAMTLSSKTIAQKLPQSSGLYREISVDFRNATLTYVFDRIEFFSNVHFAYNTQHIKGISGINYKANGKKTIKILEDILEDHALEYKLQDGLVYILPASNTSERYIKGIVTDSLSRPLGGVTVKVLTTGKGTLTNVDGEYSLRRLKDSAWLQFSSVGFKDTTVLVVNGAYATIKMTTAVKELDKPIVIGYGTTSSRFNTGSVSRHTVSIDPSPVGLMSDLMGAETGILITPAGGSPGSSYIVRIRGNQSPGLSGNHLANNSPLYVVNNAILPSGNLPFNQLASMPGDPLSSGVGMDPLSFINLKDIGSVSILKDADACSIYGSRGANGVVLITMNKGEAVPFRLTADFAVSFSRASKKPKLLNTQQYVDMRYEGLNNSGETPDGKKDGDILRWPATRYTDFSRLLLGGTALSYDANIGMVFGTRRIQWYASMNMKNRTTVLPKAFHDNRYTAYINADYQSRNNKIRVNFGGMMAYGNNYLPSKDPTTGIYLAPNAPPLRAQNGLLNWSEDSVDFTNPLASLEEVFNARSSNLIWNMNFSWSPWKNITFKNNLGLNSITLDETIVAPMSAKNPAKSPAGSMSVATNALNSVMVEPQAEYKSRFGKLSLTALLGSSYQYEAIGRTKQDSSGYKDDGQLWKDAASMRTDSNMNETFYKYLAFFARVNTIWDEKYMLNLTVRRDGSSKFSRENRFGNFWSVGAGWILSEENFFKDFSKLVSFAKIKASYGTTGNDQIGNLKYFDSWARTGLSYGSSTGLLPQTPYNAHLRWEKTNKLNIGLELSFRDRLYLIAEYYRNLSTDLITGQLLAGQTGTGEMVSGNHPARIRNTGIELSLRSMLVAGMHFHWKTSANISLPKNKLVDYPYLEYSSFKDLLVPGYAVTARRAYHYEGVDPKTGWHKVTDIKNNGITMAEDGNQIIDLEVNFYGGWSNTLVYKGFQLDINMEFRKQPGIDADYIHQNRLTPGMLDNNLYSNQPLAVLNRWRQQGDRSLYPKAVSALNAQEESDHGYFSKSSALIADASYINLQSASLQYSFSTEWLKRARIDRFAVALKGQNLFYLSPYKGGVPLTANPTGMPPVRTITFGIQATFK